MSVILNKSFKSNSFLHFELFNPIRNIEICLKYLNVISKISHGDLYYHKVHQAGELPLTVSLTNKRIWFTNTNENLLEI